MQISWLLNGRESVVRGLQTARRFVQKSLGLALGSLLMALALGGTAIAQSGPLVLRRDGRVISLVPYAPNIVRVTISTDAAAATPTAASVQLAHAGKPFFVASANDGGARIS